MPHFPDKQIGIRRQRGFSLIESLVSALILGIALFGLAGFHAAALKDGSLVKARSAAASLAQEKLDDLRSFTRLADDPSTTGVDECATPTFCFSEIAASDTINVNLGGGREDADGNLLLPSGTVYLDPPLNTKTYIDNYSRAWTVTCATETAGSALSFSGTCTGATAKLAIVTISWTDSKSVSQSVSLQSVIYAMDPLRLALGTASSVSSQKPKVGYTPIGVPDGVPVEMESGKFKESSKPAPDVSQHGHSTQVTFDTTSYSTDGNVATEIDESVTISCVCEFNGTGQGMTPSRMVWDATMQKLVMEQGKQVPKVIGRKPITGQAANQPALCDICCRDHHDVAGTTYPKYDAARYEADSVNNFDSGNHKHYLYDGSGNLTAATTGNYLEACRFKRVDGSFGDPNLIDTNKLAHGLLQDWRMVDLVVMPKDNYLSVDTSLAKYEAYLSTAMTYYGNIPAVGSSPDKASLAPRNFLQLVQGQAAQLLARGVYVDKIYCAYGDSVCGNPTQTNAKYYSDVATIRSNSGAWKKHIPFYEVNLSVLATWASGNVPAIAVANDPVQDILNVDTGYYTTYYRGRVTGGATAGTATITATTRISNTGVTSGVLSSSTSPPGPGGYALDPHDAANIQSDSITVTRLASGATFGISGNLNRTGSPAANPPKQNTWGATASGSGVTCISIGNANNPGYSCTVPSGWTGSITPFATGGGHGNDSARTLYYFSPTSRSYTDVTTGSANQHYLFCKIQSSCL